MARVIISQFQHWCGIFSCPNNSCSLKTNHSNRINVKNSRSLRARGPNKKKSRTRLRENWLFDSSDYNFVILNHLENDSLRSIHCNAGENGPDRFLHRFTVITESREVAGRSRQQWVQDETFVARRLIKLEIEDILRIEKKTRSFILKIDC
jgi:hypothetical protein